MFSTMAVASLILESAGLLFCFISWPIKNIGLLKNSLENLDWVDNVITILDVPLLKNNDDPLSERIRNFKTLSSADVNLDRGFNEITESPIYRNFVISEDGQTSGILVYIKPDKKLSEYIKTKRIIWWIWVVKI